MNFSILEFISQKCIGYKVNTFEVIAVYESIAKLQDGRIVTVYSENDGTLYSFIKPYINMPIEKCLYIINDYHRSKDETNSQNSTK